VNLADVFRDALDSLAAHKLRAILSMLGMIFGVGAVISMLAIGEGAERETLGLIERLGMRNVVVEAKELNREDLMEIREQSPGLSQRDIDAIKEAGIDLEWVAPRVKLEPYKIISAGGKVDTLAFGVSHHFFDPESLPLQAGRYLDERDESTYAQVCVIGSDVARTLFGYRAALGETLKVDDVWLEVVGVLQTDALGATSFQGVQVSSSSREIYLPYTTALRKFERPPLDSPFDRITVRLSEVASPWESAAVMHPLLDLLHGGADDYRVVVPEALMEQSRRTQRIFNLVMGLIAGISLVVGGIGIMNIMLASMLERTREIGVRRAVGARRADVRRQFLVESFSISLIGGAAGIFFGVSVAYVVAISAGWPTRVTLPAVVLSTGVSVAVGVLSGWYPANRAASLDPVRALGYE
jgi:putative ABC transport system permease protein